MLKKGSSFPQPVATAPPVSWNHAYATRGARGFYLKAKIGLAQFNKVPAALPAAHGSPIGT